MKTLTQHLSAPLAGATTAKVDIDVADGNLTIDKLSDGDSVLASGTLEYLEGQGLPTTSVSTAHGQATLTLSAKSSRRPWLHLPWATCNGATNWQIHLNPNVQSDISIQSGGGNLKLNLASMAVARVSAGTGGGNLDVVLPENAANLSVDAKTGGGNVTVEIGDGIQGSHIVNAKSGAGNVVVQIPRDIAARIYATTGLGKAIIDPRFDKTDNTYQSPDFDHAVNKVEITIQSGAGNVSVKTK